MNNEEIYKDIRGYEGMYQISNFGNVYSVRREYITSNNKVGITGGYILSKKKRKDGYVSVTLCNGGKMKSFNIHRLVASNFIENPENKPVVNHIDGDKSNNCVSNLEWVTISENTKHAYDNNLSNFRDNILNNLYEINKETMYSEIIFKKGNEIIKFNSTSDASKALGLKRDNITRAIRKKHKVSGWEVFGIKHANEEI